MTKLLSNQQITGKNYRFTVLTNELIRMEYSETGDFVDQKTQIVENRSFPLIEFDYIETSEKVEIETTGFHLYYDKQPFSETGLFIDLKSNLTDYHNRWYFGHSTETLKGTARTLDQVDGQTALDEGIISKQGFALLEDSTSFILNEEGDPVIKNSPSVDIYLFAYQRKYLQALKDYYHLTGRPPLLPRYALGNWWSRFWPYTEAEYLNLMDRFKKEEIPLSISVIDMDWHLRDIPKRFGSGWTGYTWNTELFPDPEGFLSKLHDRGLKVTLNVHPADGIRAFEQAYPKVSERLKLNVSLEEPAVFDFTSPAFREAYFKDVHHPLEEQGVDFWWIDWQQGTKSNQSGLDPLWLLNYYHFKDNEARSDGLILSRYAGPGSHRYPVGFSGDTIISWDSLKFQPYFTATASNIGYSWWSHDIGGHMGGGREDELALRWLQFGVFSPINRLHSSASPFNGKEPWRYSKEVEVGMKAALYLRHQLIPYLYTMNVRNSEEGIPLILPMYYVDANNPVAYEVENQYLFGSQMIVAPMTEKTDETYHYSSTKVWLPEGDWYDLFTGYRYRGNEQLDIYRKKEEIPVFVKAGGILPFDAQPMKTTGTDLPTEIEWHVFPGEDNHFTLVEDQGEQRVETTLTLDWGKKTIHLTLSGNQAIVPATRKHKITLHGVFSKIDATDWENKAQNQYSYSKNLQLDSHLDISLFEKIEKQEIVEEYFKRLDTAEIPYTLKEKLWDGLKKTQDNIEEINLLKNNCDDFLLGMLYEVWYIKQS